MAKAICAKSGIEFNIQYFPYNFNEGELHHPVFDLTYQQLSSESLLHKWTNREFTETDTKLYFLSLLHSSNLIEWYTYARPSLSTCELNMEALLNILSWQHTIKHPHLSMPHMAITQSTATLDNVRNWIAAWNSARQDFENGYVELTRNQIMLRQEDTLQRLIKDQQKEIYQYAGILANWASLSADFPLFNITVGDTNISLAEYWKQLIITCAKTPLHIWRLDVNDLIELEDHLITNLEQGSIYAYAVMKLVKTGIATHNDYLGYDIINYAEDIEKANLKILADNAPIDRPILSNYPNKILYLKDKIRYEQAQKMLGNLGDTTP